uniref:Uncharacterized protein n=1 Tax=Steinernema glaseri TaxID=37863 RepID=A0A1I7YRX8_9BILA
MSPKFGTISWILACALLLAFLAHPTSSNALLKSKRLSKHAIIRLMLQRDAAKYGDSYRVHRSFEDSEAPKAKRFIILERPQKTNEDDVIEQFF